MAYPAQLSLVFGAAFALALSSTCIYPATIVGLLGPQWSLQVLGWNSAPHETEEQDRIRKIIRENDAALNRIAWDVIRGKRTLYQAAAGFRMLTVTRHDLTHVPLPRDACDPVALCRQVIWWVESVGRDGKNRDVPRLVNQMQAELRQAVSRPGKPALPPVPPGDVAESLWASSCCVAH